MKPLKIFFTFFLFTILLAAGPVWLSNTGHSDYLVPKFWVIFGFITFFTLIAILGVTLAQYRNPAMYAQIFLAMTVFKMLGCLAFALVFVLKIHIDTTVFALNFAYIYFLNTAFEVYFLLRNLRNQN
ncbi:MAG: hypothetical protein JKY70_10545 [Mucilaginibacter sp.]|nr:hypothetical protein [Mucilaginibacter sp.]